MNWLLHVCTQKVLMIRKWDEEIQLISPFTPGLNTKGGIISRKIDNFAKAKEKDIGYLFHSIIPGHI